MTAVLALVAAAIFALGTVLQQRAAMTEPDDRAASNTILLRLATHPVWLAGIAAYGLAYLVQAAALGSGQIVVVQPVLATTIVFALPLGVWLSHQRVSRRDVFAAVAVTVGLGAFLLLSDPGGGRESAETGEWLIAGGAVIGGVVALVAVGRGRAGALKAAFLGTAAGLTFGLVSCLTKEVVEVFEDDGVVAMFEDWQLYAILALGFIGMTVTQQGLQTGVLPPEVATSSIFNPALSVVLGLILFDEAIHRDVVDSVAAVLALVAMFAGVAVLALSPPQPRTDEAEA
jgi:drug/metabolite transporter (DMT)-like permease